MSQFVVKEHPGIFQNIYQIIWSKERRGNDLEDLVQQARPLQFKLNIPETIVFKQGIPVGWFFTSVKTGKILRRRRQSMSPKEIVSMMTRKAYCDIVCYLVQDVGSTQRAVRIRYFGAKQLEQYFKCQRLHTNGILQQFIPPGQYDSIVQMKWSRSNHVAKLLKSKTLLSRKDLQINYKAISFDPLCQLQEQSPIYDKKLYGQILEKIDLLCSKINENSFQNVNVIRSNFYFKRVKFSKRSKSAKQQESHFNLYFLWATGVFSDLSKSQAVTFTKIYSSNPIQRIPFKINDALSNFPSKSKQNYKLKFKCPNCQNLVNQIQTIFCKYELIIKSHNAKKMLRCFQQEEAISKKQWQMQVIHNVRRNMQIPFLIRQSYPDLTVENFSKLCKARQFLNKTIKLCDLCYFQLSKEQKFEQPCTRILTKNLRPLKDNQAIKSQMIIQNRLFFKRVRQSKLSMGSKQRVSTQLTRIMSAEKSDKSLSRFNIISSPAQQNDFISLKRKFDRLQSAK